jgi:hypothetical protein
MVNWVWKFLEHWHSYVYLIILFSLVFSIKLKNFWQNFVKNLIIVKAVKIVRKFQYKLLFHPYFHHKKKWDYNNFHTKNNKQQHHQENGDDILDVKWSLSLKFCHIVVFQQIYYVISYDVNGEKLNIGKFFLSWNWKNFHSHLIWCGWH